MLLLPWQPTHIQQYSTPVHCARATLEYNICVS